MPFLLRLEKRDVLCFESVDSIFNLVTVAVRNSVIRDLGMVIGEL